MVRPKTVLEPITNKHQRKRSFEKRRVTIMKKAMELSFLCNVNIVITIQNTEKEYFIYGSNDQKMLLDHFDNYNGKYTRITNEDYKDLNTSSPKKIGKEMYKSKTNSVTQTTDQTIVDSDEKIENYSELDVSDNIFEDEFASSPDFDSFNMFDEPMNDNLFDSPMNNYNKFSDDNFDMDFKDFEF